MNQRAIICAACTILQYLWSVGLCTTSSYCCCAAVTTARRTALSSTAYSSIPYSSIAERKAHKQVTRKFYALTTCASRLTCRAMIHVKLRITTVCSYTAVCVSREDRENGNPKNNPKNTKQTQKTCKPTSRRGGVSEQREPPHDGRVSADVHPAAPSSPAPRAAPGASDSAREKQDLSRCRYRYPVHRVRSRGLERAGGAGCVSGHRV